MDAQLRAIWAEAFSDPDKCRALVEALEALLPACQGDDRVSMLQAINGLRGYAAAIFPETQVDRGHLH